MAVASWSNTPKTQEDFYFGSRKLLFWKAVKSLASYSSGILLKENIVTPSTKLFHIFYNIRPQNDVLEPSDVWVGFLILCTIIIIIVIIVTIVIMIITEMLLSASCNWK